MPLIRASGFKKALDATHADINLGSFCRKLIIKEIAEVTKWKISKDIQSIVKTAEVMFDPNHKKTVGNNP